MRRGLGKRAVQVTTWIELRLIVRNMPGPDLNLRVVLQILAPGYFVWSESLSSPLGSLAPMQTKY
jgi:hypothetical protein